MTDPLLPGPCDSTRCNSRGCAGALAPQKRPNCNVRGPRHYVMRWATKTGGDACTPCLPSLEPGSAGGQRPHALPRWSAAGGRGTTAAQQGLCAHGNGSSRRSARSQTCLGGGKRGRARGLALGPQTRSAGRYHSGDCGKPSPARPGPAARAGAAADLAARPGRAATAAQREYLPAARGRAPPMLRGRAPRAGPGPARRGAVPARRRAAAGRRGRVLPQSRPGRRGKRLRGTKVPAATAARPAGSPGAGSGARSPPAAAGTPRHRPCASAGSGGRAARRSQRVPLTSP